MNHSLRSAHSKGEQLTGDAPCVSKVTPPVAMPTNGSEAEEFQLRFRVTTCIRVATSTMYMTAREVLALDIEEVDFHHDKVFGKIGIRAPNGELRRFLGEIPGLGPDTGMPLLNDVIWAMGELIGERQLSELIRHRWKTRNARDQQVARLRAAFGDSATVQNYFIVKPRPWRIGWNTARSWRIIEV